MKLLSMIVVLVLTLLSSLAHARDLIGIDSLTFGMKLEEAFETIKDKSGAEIWNRDDNTRHIKYRTTIKGSEYEVRPFFKNEKLESISILPYPDVVDLGPNSCKTAYQNAVSAIIDRYGDPDYEKKTPSQSLKFETLWFVFENNRHIEVFHEYDSIFKICTIIIDYKNEPYKPQRIKEKSSF